MCVVCGCDFTFVCACLCVVCMYVCVHVCVCGESFAHEWGRVDVLGVELNWLLHAILLVWPGEEIAFVPMQHKHVLLNIEYHKCPHGNLQRTTSIGPGMNDIVVQVCHVCMLRSLIAGPSAVAFGTVLACQCSIISNACLVILCYGAWEDGCTLSFLWWLLCV